MTARERMHIVQGDITRLAVDAIVNAANAALASGGGVDGAIRRAAGPALDAACAALGGCPTGEARLTRGFRLPAKWVIHTAGPVWHGGGQAEPELLARCYRNCLTLAASHAIESVAFPSISTGIYGYPVGLACRIALAEVGRGLQALPSILSVTFVCFDRSTLDAYRAAWEG
jgi:O-acetyl-ADP-ribose deacetylase (regulator of RNase III)